MVDGLQNAGVRRAGRPRMDGLAHFATSVGKSYALPVKVGISS